MRVLLLGASGQLGSDIVRLWRDPAVTLVPATRADADVTDSSATGRLVARVNPDLVINTTAFHNLPQAEADPETCFRVNVLGGWHVARAARLASAAVVQISTDYVFDGAKRTPYLEDDARRGVNVYGSAKVATEDVVRQANPDSLIVRVSGLYGVAGSAGKGGNFVETMLRLAREGNPIRVVSDQVTAPTNTAEIAEALSPGGPRWHPRHNPPGGGRRRLYLARIRGRHLRDRGHRTRPPGGNHGRVRGAARKADVQRPRHHPRPRARSLALPPRAVHARKVSRRRPRALRVT